MHKLTKKLPNEETILRHKLKQSSDY